MYKEKLKVLAKIAEAKKEIRNTPRSKAGHNDYSNYDYFTPDQIVELVQEACESCGLITLFGTHRTELGLNSTLQVIDIESGEFIHYDQVTAIPEIKATNVAQQLGGMNTYSNRYLLMFAFDIVDNNLDFDAKDNRGETKKMANIKNKATSTANEANRSEKVATEAEAKPKPKTPKLPALKVDNEKWDDIIKYLKQDGTSAEDLKVRYTISKAVMMKLSSEAKA